MTDANAKDSIKDASKMLISVSGANQVLTFNSLFWKKTYS